MPSNPVHGGSYRAITTAVPADGDGEALPTDGAAYVWAQSNNAATYTWEGSVDGGTTWTAPPNSNLSVEPTQGAATTFPFFINPPPLLRLVNPNASNTASTPKVSFHKLPTVHTGNN